MRHMKQNITLVLLTAILLFASVCCADAAPQEEVGAKVRSMWEANNVVQLKQYLQGLSIDSVDNVPAVLASALYDYIFLGKLNSAKSKLLRVSAVAQSNPQVYSEAFVSSLSAVIVELNDEIRIQSAHGKSEQEWQANANPQAVRDAVGVNPFPLIELIKIAPNASLPAR